MKLRVVGWTYYDDDIENGKIGWAARNAIVDEIKKHGYMFSGRSHMEAMDCAPILNDGKLYCFTQRGWGDVMAEAHGYHGRTDYAIFAFAMDYDTEIRPKESFDEDSFVPEIDLNERFELEVSQKVFDTAKRSFKIKLDDLPELRYLDAGDTLALCCNNQIAEFTVTDVDRKKDLTEKKRNELEFAFYDFQNEQKMKLAEAEFDSVKTVIIIKLNKSTTFQ